MVDTENTFGRWAPSLDTSHLSLPSLHQPDGIHADSSLHQISHVVHDRRSHDPNMSIKITKPNHELVFGHDVLID